MTSQRFNRDHSAESYNVIKGLETRLEQHSTETRLLRFEVTRVTRTNERLEASNARLEASNVTLGDSVATLQIEMAKVMKFIAVSNALGK